MGAQGAQGETGAAGPQGGDGANSLVVQSSLPSGSQCLYGGTAFASGVDADRDGQLTAAETTSSSRVCNGAPGAHGQPGPAGPAVGAPAVPLSAPVTNAFLRLQGISDAAETVRHAGWFPMTAFGLSATRDQRGDVHWRLEATADASVGLAQIYKRAADGMGMTATFELGNPQRADGDVVLQLTAAGAVITSVSTAELKPDVQQVRSHTEAVAVPVAMTFVFDDLTVVATPLRRATTLGPMPIPARTFQISTAQSTGVVPDLFFNIGGMGESQSSELDGFTPPALTANAQDRFTDASLAFSARDTAEGRMPAITDALQQLYRLNPIRQLRVDIFSPAGRSPVVTYGYRDAVVESVTLSGLAVDVGFSAGAYEWTAPGGRESYDEDAARH
jgi:hypothetical protein